MKKYIYLFIITLLLINIDIVSADTGTGVNRLCSVANAVADDWSTNTSLNLTEISITKEKSIYVGRKATLEGGAANGGKGHYFYGRGQGFAVSDNYYLLVKIYDNTTLHNTYAQSVYPYETTGIIIVDRNTKKITDKKEGLNLGHGNDATWNSRDDTFLVINSSNDTNNKYYLEKYKVNSNGKLVTLNERITLPRCITAIAYNDDDDNYIAKGCINEGDSNTHNRVFIFDNNFNIIKQFDLQWNHLIPGGIDYANGYIYITGYESGKENIYCYYYHDGEGSNLIYQYDLNGNFIKTLYIPNKKAKGEIQSVTIDKDRKIHAFYDIVFHDYKLTEEDENEGTACPNDECVGVSTLTIYTSNVLSEIKTINKISNLSKKVYLKNDNIDKEKTFIEVTYNDGSIDVL